MDKKLKITKMVMDLERSFHEECLYSQELILVNKEQRKLISGMDKKLEEAIDEVWNYCMLWVGTLIVFFAFVLWTWSISYGPHKPIEENDNEDRIGWRSTRFQFERTQSFVYGKDTSLWNSKGNCKGRQIFSRDGGW